MHFILPLEPRTLCCFSKSCQEGPLVLPWRLLVQFSSVQSLTRVRLFAITWTAARQASLSIISTQSLLKLMSIISVMPSNYLILCHSLLLLPAIFPSIRDFPVSQFSISGGQSTGASAPASVLAMNIQD